MLQMSDRVVEIVKTEKAKIMLCLTILFCPLTVFIAAFSLCVPLYMLDFSLHIQWLGILGPVV